MVSVIFRSRKDHSKQELSQAGEHRIELSANTWDDFTYKTTFNVAMFYQGRRYKVDNIKLLLDGDNITARRLEKLVEAGWDGKFPIPDTQYISNPTQITFYEELVGVMGQGEALEVASLLRDASYHSRVLEEEAALAMTLSDGFRSSLQRERGDQIAFSQGWKAFENTAVHIEDLVFAFKDREGEVHEVPLHFSPNSNILPHDVNLLIGPNGTGKSAFLWQLVEDWLQTSNREKDLGFRSPPNFNRVIAVSYSPFERLRVDTAGLNMADPDSYKYFGLRGRRGSAQARESLSLDHAREAATTSLIACFADDRRYGAIKAWSQKIKTLYKVLKTAIDFDFVALAVPSTMAGGIFTTAGAFAVDPYLVTSSDKDGEQGWLRVDEETAPSLDAEAVRKHARPNEGVTFFKDDVPLSMSSGQRLFGYIVINILGAIRRNSLIVVDEPELFLHPTLEVSLISMLKSILEAYSCKALIATHSVILTREVPRDCVHVFQVSDSGIYIGHPPFQTFGADVQRISSYVFGDNATSKPFETWVKAKSKEMGGRLEVLAALTSEDLNEELMIELRAGDDME